MESGIFVGFRMMSSEYILFANGEAITARTIRRKLVSRWANLEEIINVLVWPWDRLGHRQEAAVRPMGGRRERNPELDEAHLPKPPAGAEPSRRVYLKQSDFDAHGLTKGCPGCRAMREGIRARKVTQWRAAHEWKNCFKEQRRANNDCRRLNAAHGTRLVNRPSREPSSSSPTDQQIPRAPGVQTPRAPAVQDPATPLQGVQVLAMLLRGVSLKIRLKVP